MAGNGGIDATTALARATATDPVCGMHVDPSKSAYVADHAGATYLFCSARCRERFVADPAKYASAGSSAPVAAAPAGTIYTCPMHPQIRQVGPGTCPICGMTLEPELSSLDDEGNPELQDFTRRFWWTLPLTFIVLVIWHLSAAQSHGALSAPAALCVHRSLQVRA